MDTISHSQGSEHSRSVRNEAEHLEKECDEKDLVMLPGNEMFRSASTVTKTVTAPVNAAPVDALISCAPTDCPAVFLIMFG